MRKQLRRAMFGQRPVRVELRSGGEKLNGYPVGIGRKWLLLHGLDNGMNLDGHLAVRVSEIAAVELPDDTLPHRVLRLRGQWPPRPPRPALPLDRTTDLLLAAGAASPLVAVECHRTDPGCRFVGLPLGVQDRQLWLHLLEHDLTWQAEPTPWALAHVTLVEVGGAYERALWEAVQHDAAPEAGTS